MTLVSLPQHSFQGWDCVPLDDERSLVLSFPDPRLCKTVPLLLPLLLPPSAARSFSPRSRSDPLSERREFWREGVLGCRESWPFFSSEGPGVKSGRKDVKQTTELTGVCADISNSHCGDIVKMWHCGNLPYREKMCPERRKVPITSIIKIQRKDLVLVQGRGQACSSYGYGKSSWMEARLCNVPKKDKNTTICVVCTCVMLTSQCLHRRLIMSTQELSLNCFHHSFESATGTWEEGGLTHQSFQVALAQRAILKSNTVKLETLILHTKKE